MAPIVLLFFGLFSSDRHRQAQKSAEGASPDSGPAGFCAGLTSKRVTDPRDYAVPLSLFRGGIINEHAVHGTARPIAAILPDAVLADAGHDEEIRCDPLVDDA